MPTNCVPPDGFWKANREIAERFWQRGDGATVSTRVAANAGLLERAAKLVPSIPRLNPA